jgi:hypothetical protein
MKRGAVSLQRQLKAHARCGIDYDYIRDGRREGPAVKTLRVFKNGQSQVVR